MPTDIKIPEVGESITEGTIARWLKRDGAPVRGGEPVLELETEKATTEIAAPASGTLVVAVPEGKTVAIGSVVGHIKEGAAPAPPASAQPAPAAPKSAAAPAKPEYRAEDKEPLMSPA